MSRRVSITMAEGVADVVLTRAEKRNAFDDAMFDSLNEAIATVAHDPMVRAVVLSGDGPCFSTGLDTAKFGQMVAGEVDGRAWLLGQPRHANGANPSQNAAVGWRDVPVPVIAAIHGTAFGAGFQLALGADLRFVTPDAQLSAFEINWGLVPDMGAFLLLRELVRADVARDLIFSGRIVEGSEALALGLATRVCADPHAEALAYAHTLAGKNPDALKAAKRLSAMAADSSARDILAAESREMAELIGSPRQIEAVKARLGKRAPVFD